jgi:hypothetical protein
MHAAGIFVLLLLSISLASARIRSVTDGLERFMGLEEFPNDLRAFQPTGAPGARGPTLIGDLPSAYPLVPGFEGTRRPDSGLRALTRPDGTECECPRPHPFDFRDTERDTVCLKETAQAFSSLCTAECMGYTAADVYPCKPRWALYRLG